MLASMCTRTPSRTGRIAQPHGRAQISHTPFRRQARCAVAAPDRNAVLFPDAAALLPHELKVPQEDRINQSGLNGLTAAGVTGVDSGVFTVSAVQPIQYTVQEVADLLDPANETLLSAVVPGSHPQRLSPGRSPLEQRPKRLVVVDANVERICGDQIRAYFDAHGAELHLLALPTWEDNKEFELVFRVAEEIERVKLNRRKEPLIAIGGGVCLDICGLAANLYRRNTPIIKVPTTLMAVVDASIGIKTAVNFIGKKNKMGTYCPPLAVFTDRSFLRTQDDRNLANGAAEMLKMACVKDRPLFELLESQAAPLMATRFQSSTAGTAIRRSIQGMLEELEYNLFEHILVRLVDYGHTFSMDVEMAALRSGILHGEAVSIDMALTTVMARRRGMITESEAARVFAIMAAFRLPIWHPVCAHAQLWQKALADIVKTRDGFQRTPLMCGIGEATFVNDITEAELLASVAELQDLSEEHPTSHMEVAMAANAPVTVTPQSEAVLADFATAHSAAAGALPAEAKSCW